MFNSQARTALRAAMWLVVAGLTAILMIGGTGLVGSAAVPVIAVVVALALMWAYFRAQR
jgi:hypothetical protein